MYDWCLTLAIQHYVVFGIVAIAVGVLLNILISAGSEIAELVRFRKFY